MQMRALLRLVFLVLCFELLGLQSARPGDTPRLLEYAPGPADNPLKGLVPYASAGGHHFPHSMEFSYFPFSALVTGYDRYNWAPLESFLNEAAGRGHQGVFRVYLEWPGRAGAIPAFLINDRLKVYKFTDTRAQPPQDNETPDYTAPRLRAVLLRFIAAWGRKYDGDPRVGFITAGLLGGWGEWHGMAPRYELFAGKELQTAVMDAYEAAFATTRILLRYPMGGEGSRALAPNAKRRFGYHDDSFAWGYDFHVSAVTIAPVRMGKLRVKVELVNRGVAPFYYDWPAEFGLIVGSQP